MVVVWLDCLTCHLSQSRAGQVRSGWTGLWEPHWKSRRIVQKKLYFAMIGSGTVQVWAPAGSVAWEGVVVVCRCGRAGVASLSGHCSVSCVQDNGSFGDRAIIFFLCFCCLVAIWISQWMSQHCHSLGIHHEKLSDVELPVFPVADMM